MKKITIIALASIAAFSFCGKKQYKTFEHQGFAGWIAAKDIRINQIEKGTSITLKSSADRPVSAGKTQGAFLTIPVEIANSYSGQLIRISFTAKRAPKNSSDSIWVAYSTAEVGNSGWKKFALTQKFKEYSFEYEVPELKQGNEDFIGFNSDLTGKGKTAIVDKVKVEVIGPEDI